jgi:cell division septation protein DedD
MAAIRRARLGVVLVAVLLVVGACATAASPGSSVSKTIRPSDSAGAAAGPTSPVVGIVTSVDPAAAPSPSASAGKTAKPSGKPKTAPPTASPAPTEVKGFTLLTTAGDTLTFVIGQLDNADDFPPDSLYDRMSTEDPIRVDFTVDGDKLVVTHIEDAG